MTRVEALERAIEIVRGSKIQKDEKENVISKLELCISELPFSHWTEAAIFDACDEFIRVNKRGITTSDFLGKSLPSHTAIKNRFKMTAKEFRDKYYPLPEKRPEFPKYSERKIAFWTASFVDEYNRIHPISSYDYNLKRDKDTPTWKKVAKMNKVKTWDELLVKLNLYTYDSGRTEYKFKVEFDLF